MKKIICVILLCFLIGCKAQNDDLEWKNEEAVYVSVIKQYRNEIFKDTKTSFSSYNYDKMYILNKYTSIDGEINYRLLFIVKTDMEDFLRKLKEDNRIEFFSICKDLPYESFDDRYIQTDKNKIYVGDNFSISIKGDCDKYMQQFYYDSIYVKPVNYDSNKDYGIGDFSEINNIKSIRKKTDGIIIKMDKSNYYYLIKTIDLLSRSSLYQLVDFDYIYAIHPIWEVSNDECVSWVVNDDNSLTVTALKAGVVTFKYDGIECNITINNRETDE